MTRLRAAFSIVKLSCERSIAWECLWHDYPLVMTNSLRTWKWPSRNRGFSNMVVIFQFVMWLRWPGRVSPIKSPLNPMKNHHELPLKTRRGIDAPWIFVGCWLSTSVHPTTLIQHFAPAFWSIEMDTEWIIPVKTRHSSSILWFLSGLTMVYGRYNELVNGDYNGL